MADVTISLSTIEEKVLETVRPTVQEAVESAVNRLVKVTAQRLIEESSSKLDPRKMNAQELKNELLIVQDEITTRKVQGGTENEDNKF